MSLTTIKEGAHSAGWLSFVAVFTISILSLTLVHMPSLLAESEAPDNGVSWPVCSSGEQWYCIDSGSRDFVSITDGEGGEQIEEGGNVAVHANFLDENSVNWAITWSSNANTLPDEVADQTFRFTLRTGAMEPNFTYALSDEFYLSTGGNADDGYTLNIEATPTRINWLTTTDEHNCWANDCGDETTTANIDNRVISGNTQNMALWDPGEKAVWKGAYMASNAQYRSTVPIYGTFPEPYWSVSFGNPHLTLDEEPADGSFTAWVPPTYFDTLDTTTEEAVANGFSITRDDDGELTTIEGAASAVDGGAYLRIPSLSYSSPDVIVSPLSDGEPSVIAPGAPSAVDINPGPGSLAIDFNPPHFDGGSEITSYEATCVQGDASFTGEAEEGEGFVVVTGMAGGIEASCTVKAINEAGESDPSNAIVGTPNDPLTNEEDLNNDGIEDADQAYVGAITNSVTGKTVVVEMDEDCDFQSLTTAAESSNSTADVGFAYSNGLIDFTAACGGPGQAPHIKLYFYHVSPSDFVIRKYNPTTHTYFSLPAAVVATETIFGNQVLTVTYQVEDGSTNDVDGLPNGTIVDPVGLGTVDVAAPNTGFHL